VAGIKRIDAFLQLLIQSSGGFHSYHKNSRMGMEEPSTEFIGRFSFSLVFYSMVKQTLAKISRDY
jgi:hypothetical protein